MGLIVWNTRVKTLALIILILTCRKYGHYSDFHSIRTFNLARQPYPVRRGMSDDPMNSETSMAITIAGAVRTPSAVYHEVITSNFLKMHYASREAAKPHNVDSAVIRDVSPLAAW
jgi:hypothetical protein